MKASNQFIRYIVIALLTLGLIPFQLFGQRYAVIPKDGNIYVNPELGNNENPDPVKVQLNLFMRQHNE